MVEDEGPHAETNFSSRIINFRINLSKCNLLTLGTITTIPSFSLSLAKSIAITYGISSSPHTCLSEEVDSGTDNHRHRSHPPSLQRGCSVGLIWDDGRAGRRAGLGASTSAGWFRSTAVGWCTTGLVGGPDRQNAEKIFSMYILVHTNDYRMTYSSRTWTTPLATKTSGAMILTPLAKMLPSLMVIVMVPPAKSLKVSPFFNDEL